MQVDRASIFPCQRVSVHESAQPKHGRQNEPPKVDIDIQQGNKTFFFPNKPIGYVVQVVDAEDGSLADGRITPDQVTVSIDYVAKRFDRNTAPVEPLAVDASATYATAQRLIMESDCQACHSVNNPGVGPTYERIAKKYKGDAGAIDRLAKKVISGGRGVWGEVTMSAHPQLSVENATAIVTYILSVGEARSTLKTLPVTATYVPVIPEGETETGFFRLRAAYKDRGTQSMGPILSDKVLYFRSPVLLPAQADWRKTGEKTLAPDTPFMATGPQSSLGYAQLDLTNIGQLEVMAQAPAQEAGIGGTIEVRLGSVEGKLIGKAMITAENLTHPDKSKTVTKAPALVNLTPTVGVHDVYFVFQNSQATPKQVLMHIDSLVVKSVEENSASR
ncbi:hypothetical protein GCM10028807_37040 [Spirosoma daeguense]